MSFGSVALRAPCAMVLVLVAACSGKEGKPIEGSPNGSGTAAVGSGAASGNSFDRAIGELEGFKTKMCECKDVLCTDRVFADFTTWRAEFKKSVTTGQKPTRDQDVKGNTIDREMKACRAKVASEIKVGSASAGSAGSNANPIDTALVDLDGFKTKMCACPDKTCADKLQAELATWKRNLRAKMTEKPNALQEIKGNAIDKDIVECRKKAEAGTPGAPGGTSKIDNMLTQMGSFRDKLCACTTKDCGSKLEKEIEAWQQQAGKDLADAKPTKDQDDKADRLQAEMKTCVGKLK